MPGRLSSHVPFTAGPAKRGVATRLPILAGAACLAGVVFAPWIAPAGATPLVPAGFVVETVAAGLQSPTAVAALPDGRLLVTEQPGRVRLVEDDTLRAAPVWAAEKEILFNQESGLVGIAVDPDYASNHYLYFWYTVDPDSDGVDDDVGAFGRLTRYQMRFDGSDTVDPASRTILLGTGWADAPITGADTHTVGSLRWGADGTLLVSHGDGDDWSQTDPGGLYPQVFGPGRADPAMDIGAWRSQSISSLNGKILRLDPATGHGLASNPFYDGDPTSNRSKVFAYGFRNPFRFSVRPGTGDPDPTHGDPGVLYVGDVGWFRWEELDVVEHSGMNFGWPLDEGFLPEIEYSMTTPLRLGPDSVGTVPDDPEPTTWPIAAINHGEPNSGVPGGFPGGATVGGTFYTGTRYPAAYHGRWFHADYGSQGGWIRAATMTPSNHLISFGDFGTRMDAPVDLLPEPGTGDILYVSYFTGQLRRIRWTGAPATVVPPVAFGRCDVRLGVAPLSVNFLSHGSYDPDGGAISTEWDFGDGATSTDVDPQHTYASPGVYLARLAVTDAEMATDSDTFTVVVTAQPVLPTTAVLDSFDRPDGSLGESWTADQPGLAVMDSALVVTAPGRVRALWNAATFGSTQEAWTTLGPNAHRASRVALILKAQGLGATDARVEVSYDPVAGTVLVTTDDLSFGKLDRGGPVPVTFAPGDRFGARCTTDGRIEVFQNGSRIASSSLAGWPAIGAGGSIGLWIEVGENEATPLAGNRPGSLSLSYTRDDPRGIGPMLPSSPSVGGILNDFGGGDSFVPGNHRPVVNVLSPADSSFFDGVGSIALEGVATDLEDPIDSLKMGWKVTRHHTNHTDVTQVFVGPNASFTPIDPGSEAGTWYELRFSATDTQGLADSTRLLLFPQSNLRPAGLVTNADHVPPGTDVEAGFWIRNDGPLISTRSFWRVLLDGVSLDTQPASIAGHDSVYVRLALPALVAGSHVLRVVADTLRQCVETNEGDNALVFGFDSPPASVGVGGDAPRALALSGPRPNPAVGAVRFALDLPAASTVDLEVHDLQGRTVFADRGRAFAAGRWTLAWDGRDAGGRRVAPGVYVTTVRAGGRKFVRRVAQVR